METTQLKRLTALTKLKVIEISAFAYRGFKQYGIAYAVFFVVFEVTEHTIFAWLPPMCPLYHAGFFAAADFLSRFKTLFRTKTGMTLSERTRSIGISLYLDVFFWRYLRELAIGKGKSLSRKQFRRGIKAGGENYQSALSGTKFWEVSWHDQTGDQALTPFSLEDDLDFIFSKQAMAERYWVAMRQIDGLDMLVEFANTLLLNRLENKEITVTEAFKNYGELGSLSKTISRYRETLRVYALIDDGQKYELQRRAAANDLQQILVAFSKTNSLSGEERENINLKCGSKLKAVRL